ncbi:MAG: PLP-dependent aspartate aminotransferase family protein [Phycisphaerales bacterium]|jgi:cystathionine gamma-lyase|nr:PLP-dependent aspartate aminotransferase family protein [Phycisphaerales bacterium]
MTTDSTHMGTMAVHAGQSPCPTTGAVMPPVYLSSTYAQRSPGAHAGFEYTRSHNPTRYALERSIARLEGSSLRESTDASFGGFAFSSGMAAISCLLDSLTAGDRVLAMDDLYGGTHRLFRQVRARAQGLQFDFADLSNLDAVEAAITPETKLLWVESPTNPMLKLADLKGLAAIAKAHGILCACDNTFATPVLQRPLESGFDVVMHSATKYLGGHSDVVAGILVTGCPQHAETIRFHQNSVGSVLGPFDSYLVLRGIKTLDLRMRAHCRSAAAIAEMLSGHAKVRTTVYPTHPDHPQFDLAAAQMQIDGTPAGGGMVTIELDSDLAGCRRFLESLSVFTLAESLGGVESLANHPAIMTHASVPAEARSALGINDSLVRLSVGIEDVRDLVADLQSALDAI